MARKTRGIAVTKTTINQGQIVWRVNVQASMAGKRIRRFFSEEAAALSWADDFERRIKEKGIAGISAGGMTVKDAARRYFASRGLRGDNARLANFWIGHFLESEGENPIEQISAQDLERFWLNGGWAPNTQLQARTYLRAFFGWCERHDILTRNPVLRADAPAPSKASRDILTPDQMLEAWRAADAQIRGYLCLGGFAGLRTSEILYSRILVEETEIHIEDGKTGGRYVARLPVFDRFWTGEFVQPNYRTFRRNRTALVEALGWKHWPGNCLRHSFASYHLAMLEDAGKTAYQLGHTSPQMVYQAYARAVRKADAVRWWDLAP